MPFKDDIRQLADLKQQILQKMILLHGISPEVQNDLGDLWIILYA